MVQSEVKTIDGIKPEPQTEKELHERWCNRLKSELRSMPSYGSKKIQVKQVEKLDDKECPPSSRGRTECERRGFHSWFHHSQDGLFGDLPEGFVEP